MIYSYGQVLNFQKAYKASLVKELYMNATTREYNWRDGALQVITKRKEQLESIIQSKSVALNQPQEGKLRIQKRKNSFQYFLRTDPKDPNGKYLPLDKRQIAARIAQRDYDERIVEAAKKELKIAANYVEVLQHESVSEVFESLNPGKQVLVTPVFVPDEQYVEDWINKDYMLMPFQDENEFYSHSGTRVRSKSELIIVNALEQHKIPYRYEYPITLQSVGQVRPDFTCLNVRTRQEFIWEHFGMMDNIAYANKNISKIGAYEQSGYYPGKNMIMTFETSQHALSSNIINAMIVQYLI
jgi:hypothetical protein